MKTFDTEYSNQNLNSVEEKSGTRLFRMVRKTPEILNERTLGTMYRLKDGTKEMS